MGVAVAQAPGTGRIRFRSTLGQWAWLLGVVGGAFIVPQLVLALALSNSSAPGQPLLVPSLTFVLVWAVISSIVYRWQGVTLTAEELHVHNLRQRVIGWSDIESVTVERLLGVSSVIVRETSGRQTRLRAPSTGFLAWDPAFDTKYRTIAEWHQALRG